uniref:C2 domain-containing protein n=1 Tax=Timema monikensis TaxID=170555 RepID=A0A7R9EA50_9NEOP|nr:unnamed protein product [Timema monikensis]
MRPPKRMFLGVWGKLLVIAIGAAVVVLVVLIVVCFVGPGCWGYQCLHKEEEEKKKRLEFGDLQEGKKFENVDLADLSSSKRKKSNLVYDSDVDDTEFYVDDAYMPYYALITRVSWCVHFDELGRLMCNTFWLSEESNGKLPHFSFSWYPLQCHLGFTADGGAVEDPTNLRVEYYSYSGILLGRLPHHRDSTYSSMSENSERRSLSFRSMLTEDSAVTTNGTSTCTNKENPPVLNMSLQFLIITDADIVTEVLNNNIQAEDGASGDEEDNSSAVHERPISSVAEAMDHIQELESFSVCGLPEKEYSGYLEPYLVVQVMKSTWPLHRRAGAPLFYLRTRTIRHTHNPQFHQTFVLDAAKTHIKDWCMKMTVYDQDRFANHTELCVLNLPLKDIKLLNSNPNPIELSYNLMQSEKEFGELLIGICYLPTAQRLSFSIIKAINLKFLEITESIDTFYPYVRVIQLNGTSARAVKKKKTAYKHATESPNFNETLTFDLAPSQLETATFLVTVSNKNMEEAQPGLVHNNNTCHLSHTRYTAVTRYTQTPDSLTHPQTRRPARWSLWLTHLTRRSTQCTHRSTHSHWGLPDSLVENQELSTHGYHRVCVYIGVVPARGLESSTSRIKKARIKRIQTTPDVSPSSPAHPPPLPPSPLIHQSSEKVAAYLPDKENKERSQGKQ